MSGQPGIAVAGSLQNTPSHDVVEVNVSYLPATGPFHRAYPEATALSTVRADAMGFFGVVDRQQGRDTYTYFFEFEARRITNLSETLTALLGPDRRGAELHLVEQITQGWGVA